MKYSGIKLLKIYKKYTYFKNEVFRYYYPHIIKVFETTSLNN